MHDEFFYEGVEFASGLSSHVYDWSIVKDHGAYNQKGDN